MTFVKKRKTVECEQLSAAKLEWSDNVSPTF